MLKNYKLKLFAAIIVFGVSMGSVNALNPNLTPSIVIADNSDEWIMVLNREGVKTFLMETTGTDGVTLLKIKFENTSNNIISFNWSIGKNSEFLFDEVSNRIDPLGSLEIDPVKILIPINKGESYNDFSVTINIK